jgi:hypothetical protein
MPLKLRVVIHLGLLPLWLLPFGALVVVQTLLVLSIGFGLLSDTSIESVTMVLHVVVQAVVLSGVLLYSRLLVRMVAREETFSTAAVAACWLLPLVFLGAANLMDYELPISWTRSLVYASPALVHCYFAFRPQ